MSNKPKYSTIVRNKQKMGSLAHHSAVSLVHVHTQSQNFSKTSSNLPTEQEYMKHSSHVCTLVKILTCRSGSNGSISGIGTLDSSLTVPVPCSWFTPVSAVRTMLEEELELSPVTPSITSTPGSCQKLLNTIFPLLHQP